MITSAPRKATWTRPWPSSSLNRPAQSEFACDRCQPCSGTFSINLTLVPLIEKKVGKLTRVSECGEFVMRVIQGALMAEWIKTLLSYQLSTDELFNGVGSPTRKAFRMRS